MLRLLLFYVLLVPVTLYYSLRTLLLRPDAPEPLKHRYRGHAWGAWLVRAAGLDVQADFSTLDPAGHYVFMINHQSNLDIPILFSALGGYSIRFVAKKSLFDIPVFGRAMHKAGHISIDRANRRDAMRSVEAAVGQARAGACPVIFPEGTRNRSREELLDFKIGGMVLALKCGLPVAPVVMAGSGQALPKGGVLIRRRRPVRIRSLPVIDPARYTLKDRERFRDELRQSMNAAFQELMAEVRACVREI
jgi:1-acyl-sn-glycerol-3-phosphate acyltransferase